MRQTILVLAVLATLALATAPAWAGSPHYVGTCTATISGTCVTVSGKEAGLGDESQIFASFTATAECINGGTKHPKASNKTGVAGDGTFPVQNGKADITLQGCAVFQPDCTPPMTVTFTDVILYDNTNGIHQTCTVQ